MEVGACQSRLSAYFLHVTADRRGVDEQSWRQHLRLHYDGKGKKIVQASEITEFGADASEIHPQRLLFQKKRKCKVK